VTSIFEDTLSSSPTGTGVPLIGNQFPKHPINTS